jgi:hypothetical protein
MTGGTTVWAGRRAEPKTVASYTLAFCLANWPKENAATREQNANGAGEDRCNEAELFRILSSCLLFRANTRTIRLICLSAALWGRPEGQVQRVPHFFQESLSLEAD